MHDISLDALEPIARGILERAGVSLSNVPEFYFRAALAIVKEKIKLGRELPEWMSFFFTEDFVFDEAAVRKVFNADGLAHLVKLRETLSALDAEKFTAAELENEFKTLAAATGQKVGAYVHPARLATSGRPVGPSLYHLLEVLGRDRVLARLQRAESKFAKA
jgi:glutamyl-tRNA synthetase